MNLLNKRMDEDATLVRKTCSPIERQGRHRCGGNINKLHKLSLKPVTEALSYEYVNGQRTFIEGLDVERRITEMGLNFDRADVITLD